MVPQDLGLGLGQRRELRVLEQVVAQLVVVLTCIQDDNSKRLKPLLTTEIWEVPLG